MIFGAKRTTRTRRWIKLAALPWAIVVILLALLAIPIPVWRTGEFGNAELSSSNSNSEIPSKIWIDTDPACGHNHRSDPDDCLAIAGLVATRPDSIVGISTVFGNAEIDVTHPTTTSLMSRLHKESNVPIRIHRGAGEPWTSITQTQTAASNALANALKDSKLTILALGPLTNIAQALRTNPDLEANVEQIVAVVGKRPGHLFHPSEGKWCGIWFGHGPVFSDLNFRMDPEALNYLLSTDVPFTLIPYEAARDILLTAEDLEKLAATGPAGAWIADSAQGWLEFWRNSVGPDGFHPFDVVAAHFVTAPSDFACTTVNAEVKFGWAPDWMWMLDNAGLIVSEQEDSGSLRTVTYCPDVQPAARRKLIDIWLGGFGVGSRHFGKLQPAIIATPN